MNHFRMILAATAALAIGATASAHPEHQSTQEEVREIKIVKADGKKMSRSEAAADCGVGRKFESSASSGDEKNKNVSKIVLCSSPGENDEAWVKTLREALARVEGNSDMPADSKAKIIADLQSEIARSGK